jgi:hypothetical protein
MQQVQAIWVGEQSLALHGTVPSISSSSECAASIAESSPEQIKDTLKFLTFQQAPIIKSPEGPFYHRY